MAKYTSSQGNFTWNQSSSESITDEEVQEIKNNADYLHDNLETCFSENAAQFLTRYSDHRATNNDAK